MNLDTGPLILHVPDTDRTRDVIARALWEQSTSGWPWQSYLPDADVVLDVLRRLPDPPAA